MVVYLLPLIGMKLLRYTSQFEKEIAKFSEVAKEDIFLLVKIIELRN